MADRLEIEHDNLTLVAAGMAFYGLLALIPGMVALVSLYGLVADPEDEGLDAGGDGLEVVDAVVDIEDLALAGEFTLGVGTGPRHLPGHHQELVAKLFVEVGQRIEGINRRRSS